MHQHQHGYLTTRQRIVKLHNMERLFTMTIWIPVWRPIARTCGIVPYPATRPELVNFIRQRGLIIKEYTGQEASLQSLQRNPIPLQQEPVCGSFPSPTDLLTNSDTKDIGQAYTAQPPCCSRCFMSAQTIQFFYWPDLTSTATPAPTSSPKNATVPPNGTVVYVDPDSGFTLWVIFRSLKA